MRNSEAELRANAKLMLTGEYFVLDGAKSLALPLCFGQSMRVKEYKSKTSKLNFQSQEANGEYWFRASLSIPELELIEFEGKENVALKLESIFKEIKKLNPVFLDTHASVEVQVQADFDLSWGLGSSSTLISVLARWAEVDPYELQFRCFGGSGYDIACAESDRPIIYIKLPHPTYQKVYLPKEALQDVLFVYTGQKQNSREGIAHYRNLNIKEKGRVIEQLNTITENILKSQDKKLWQDLLNEHELLISEAIKMEAVKTKKFPDFPGALKSMGAWGGDFIMAIPDGDVKEAENYFYGKGLNTYFRSKGFLQL